MKKFAILALAPLILLAACKPPPTDADMQRDMPQAAPIFASDPLPSPDTEGAFWAVPSPEFARIIYGVPGQPPLLALQCVSPENMSPVMQITRLSPADDSAKALLAMVGNGHIGRIAVDADDTRGRGVWRGGAPAADIVWEAIAGPRQLTVTVPGAGMVTVGPSTLPGELIRACRNGEPFAPMLAEGEALPDEEADGEAEDGQSNDGETTSAEAALTPAA